MTPDELIGWFAASLVFAAFCAREMVPLRALAIASNVAFISYGYVDHLWPIFILHASMLPMNVVRLWQALSSTGGNFDRGSVRSATAPGYLLKL